MNEKLAGGTTTVNRGYIGIHISDGCNHNVTEVDDNGALIIFHGTRSLNRRCVAVSSSLKMAFGISSNSS